MGCCKSKPAQSFHDEVEIEEQTCCFPGLKKTFSRSKKNKSRALQVMEDDNDDDCDDVILSNVSSNSSVASNQPAIAPEPRTLHRSSSAPAILCQENEQAIELPSTSHPMDLMVYPSENSISCNEDTDLQLAAERSVVITDEEEVSSDDEDIFAALNIRFMFRLSVIWTSNLTTFLGIYQAGFQFFLGGGFQFLQEMEVQVIQGPILQIPRNIVEVEEEENEEEEEEEDEDHEEEEEEQEEGSEEEQEEQEEQEEEEVEEEEEQQEQQEEEEQGAEQEEGEEQEEEEEQQEEEQQQQQQQEEEEQGAEQEEGQEQEEEEEQQEQEEEEQEGAGGGGAGGGRAGEGGAGGAGAGGAGGGGGGGVPGGSVPLRPVHHPRKSLSEKHPKRG